MPCHTVTPLSHSFILPPPSRAQFLPNNAVIDACVRRNVQASLPLPTQWLMIGRTFKTPRPACGISWCSQDYTPFADLGAMMGESGGPSPKNPLENSLPKGDTPATLPPPPQFLHKSSALVCHDYRILSCLSHPAPSCLLLHRTTPPLPIQGQ